MIEIHFKRPDGTFVIEAPWGGPYHVTPNEAMWRETKAAAKARGLANIPNEPPPVPRVATLLQNQTIWQRMTEEEAGKVDTALRAAGVRIIRLFESIALFNTTNPDHQAVLQLVADVLGERAAIVLAPEF